MKKNYLIFCLSFFICITLPFFFGITNLGNFKTNIIWIVLILPMYNFIYKNLSRITKRKIIIFFFPSFLFTLILKIGNSLSVAGYLDYSLFEISKVLVLCLCFAVPCFLIIIVFTDYISKTRNQLKVNQVGEIKFIYIFLIFLLLYVPFFLAFYPGILTYDFPQQLSQLSQKNISTHHPLIHTLLLDIILIIGKKVNNYILGAAVYTLLQSLVCALINSYVLYKLTNFCISRKIYFLIFLYYSLFPLNLVFPFVATKDVLFSSLFLLFIYKCLEFLYLKKEISFLNVCELIILICLVGLFRKNAIYAILVSLPFILLITRGETKKKLIFVFVLGSIFTVGFDKILVGITSASSGLQGEAYSIPLVQIARSYTYNKKSFDSKNLKEIRRYLPEATLEKYNPRISDSVKGSFSLEDKDASRSKFLLLWAKIGKKNFTEYSDAFLMLTQGWWDPNFQFPDNYYKLPIVELGVYGNILTDKLTSDSKFSFLNNKVNTFFLNKQLYRKIPLVSLFFSPGFIIWLLILLFLLSVYLKIKEVYIIYIFIFLYFGTLLLGPVSLVRYAYPLMLVWPLFVIPILDKKNSQSVNYRSRLDKYN